MAPRALKMIIDTLWAYAQSNSPDRLLNSLLPALHAKLSIERFELFARKGKYSLRKTLLAVA